MKKKVSKQIVEPASRRPATHVVNQDINALDGSMESAVFLNGLKMDLIKDTTLKEIVDRVELFRDRSRDNIRLLSTALERNEMDRVEGLAQGLAEMCSEMGAVSMLRLCYQIQITARSGNDVSGLIKRLKVENQEFNSNVAQAS